MCDDKEYDALAKKLGVNLEDSESSVFPDPAAPQPTTPESTSETDTLTPLQQRIKAEQIESFFQACDEGSNRRK